MAVDAPNRVRNPAAARPAAPQDGTKPLRQPSRASINRHSGQHLH